LAEVTFGEWLKRQRGARGWTQEQLATQLSCSLSALRKFESEERHPAPEIVELLAEIFNVPEEERKSFLRYARGDWQAMSDVEHKDAPWRGGGQTETVHSSAPSGTVTFLFTDIEGSTKLAQSHPDQWETLRERHHTILKNAIEGNSGYVFQVIGDAFCAAFPNAGDALQAVIQSQIDLHNEKWGDTPIKVRMGLHTGKAEFQPNGEYHGYLAMSRVQRLMSVAYGEQILLSDTSASLVRGELPEGISLLDLKEHRLKGLLLPEHLWQVVIPDLPRDFPPLASLNDIPNNLPTQLTSFVGREKAIEEVKNELSEHRLVTLTGSGGTGKTRLSLQVATELLDQFEQGVWFIELAPLSDPDLIPQTIQNAMGLVEQKGISILQALQEYLQDRKVLLVLDNCEHLLEASANVAHGLLSHSTHLKILASSREALGVQGEVAWRVPSLSLPDTKNIPSPEELSQYEGVKLFIERASLVSPRFEVNKTNAPAIAQVCFRLGGIPLAIELAAARIKALSVEQINARLDDRFRLLTGGARTALPRQQTLRALIDWSYNLLNEKEKILLRRLAVFVGGWSLEGAESVCSDEQIDSDEVLDLMSSLVDKSLLNTEEFQGEVRYHRLETIRQYAREKFFDTNEVEKLRDRHLKYYVKLAEKAEPEIRGANQLFWLDHLEVELDNIRSALEWAQERDKESFIRLASALWRFWSIRISAENEWLSRALTSTAGLQSVLRARALARASYHAVYLGEVQWAKKWATEAELASRALDDKPSLALALNTQGVLETDQIRVLALLDQGLGLAQEIGDHWLMAGILTVRGDCLLNQNDFTSAHSCFEQAVKESRRSGDRRRISVAVARLSNFAIIHGNGAQAENLLREAMMEAEAIRDHTNIFYMHSSLLNTKVFFEDFSAVKEMIRENFRLAQIGKFETNRAFRDAAWVEYTQGNVHEAIRLLEEGLDLAQQGADSFSIADLSLFLGNAFRRIGDFVLAEEKFGEALVVIRKENLPTDFFCNYCEGMSLLAIDQGYIAKGAGLLGAWKRARTTVFLIESPFEARERESYIAKSRAALGEEAFNQAWEAGQAMTVEKAIEFALKELEE